MKLEVLAKCQKVFWELGVGNWELGTGSEAYDY